MKWRGNEMERKENGGNEEEIKWRENEMQRK